MCDSDYIGEVLNKLSIMLPAFMCGLLIGLQHKEDKHDKGDKNE